jgi:hypothetical protein
MLMDYENSRLIAAGVPKGKKIKDGKPHPFYELFEKAGKGDPNYVRYTFPTRSNPFLREEDIKEIEAALDSKMKLQEIDGQFIDNTDNPYLYAFEVGTHVVKSYQPDVNRPIWLSFDFNVEPNSCIVGQQTTHRDGVVFDEVSVVGKTEEVCNVILAKYGHWVNRGMLFVTGDATGNNRNAMSGALTNYLIIKKALALKDFNLKVRTVNEDLKASRVFCNAVLSKLPVTVTANCSQVVSDCQLAHVDAGGDLVKSSGLHKFDCFRYIITAWFPDYLQKPEKYLPPTIVNQNRDTKLQAHLKTKLL